MRLPEIQVRRATDHDKRAILELLTENRPDIDAERRYGWLYTDNPHGRAVTMIATDPATNEAVGVTSLFPRRVLVGGRLRLGSIGGDGYVRPTHRRRGIATAMHRACLEEMRRGDDVEFMFGAPVPDNLHALEKAGARIVTELQRFSRPGFLQRSFRAFGALVRGSAPALSPVERDDPRVRNLCDAADTSGVVPVRDAAYYAWRFSASPSGAQRAFVVVDRGQPVALCALETRDDCVGIVDFVAPSGRTGPALSATASACGTRKVTMLVNAQHPIATALLECGFLPRETKEFQVLVPNGYRDEAALLKPEDWYYTWGDNDVDFAFEAQQLREVTRPTEPTRRRPQPTLDR